MDATDILDIPDNTDKPRTKVEIAHTVTITYVMDEADYPGGITETDIMVEQDILLKALRKGILREMAVMHTELDVSVEKSDII